MEVVVRTRVRQRAVCRGRVGALSSHSERASFVRWVQPRAPGTHLHAVFPGHVVARCSRWELAQGSLFEARRLLRASHAATYRPRA